MHSPDLVQSFVRMMLACCKYMQTPLNEPVSCESHRALLCSHPAAPASKHIRSCDLHILRCGIAQRNETVSTHCTPTFVSGQAQQIFFGFGLSEACDVSGITVRVRLVPATYEMMVY